MTKRWNRDFVVLKSNGLALIPFKLVSNIPIDGKHINPFSAHALNMIFIQNNLLGAKIFKVHYFDHLSQRCY